MTVVPAPVRPPARTGTGTGPRQLLEAGRLGAAVATADLTGRPDEATAAYASWRRLRRRADRRSRQVLRVAFDAGYGRAVHETARELLPR